ncbi:hypothetical protein C2S53_012522 [Perilla frutescens var. hirtella]|uniref:GB1/RHD3-type G domain-containing protein n=1 Tax=Perilla frutescens var. hirtella TaxID=608512 RepID=A0AAD4PE72_PERFH|nr:hypothetical protein C2S53_012522 [Perilla frutescens var. hirtella]
MMRLFGRSPAPESLQSETPPTPLPAASPNISAGPARPIRLVYTDDKGRFHMDPEAVALLHLVRQPVDVVSVCGRSPSWEEQWIASSIYTSSLHKRSLAVECPPIRRTALDGTEYNLLLLDSEGIDAYDQTGTYSTQIFSLAVLLSSLFIYSQMGGIDEVALDRLSLVTEMTKHIRVRASGGRSTTSEIGQFSPIFVWLLRDFIIELKEDNKKIMPCDYLELALRPAQGGKKDIAAKNEPSLFFLLLRTRPKQIGRTVMAEPIFAGITQSFLDALNNGAVPTITSSWHDRKQNAREHFTVPNLLRREAHEDAVQKSMAMFNYNAVGAGQVRQKYEKRLRTFLKKAFEDIKKDAFPEAYLHCISAVENMERELSTACHAPGAKVLDELLSKYEAFCHGPEKWQKVVIFLRQSLEGPILDFIKKQINLIGVEKSSIALKCRSIEDKIELLNKQLEASENYKSEYLKRYQMLSKTRKNSQMTAAESKVKNYDQKTSRLKLEIKELGEKEKVHLEQKYRSQFDRFEEIQGRCTAAEKEAKRTMDLVDEAKAAAASAQKEKVERYRAAERDALLKVETLEDRIREKEKEIDSLLQSNNSQRKDTVQVLESLLESERLLLAQKQITVRRLSLINCKLLRESFIKVSQDLTALIFGEKSTLDGKLKSAPIVNVGGHMNI